MAKLVVQGAMLSCTMGTVPSSLSVLPTNQTTGMSANAATVQDMQPMVNIAPFGMCMSPSNPQVAAATAAALGVLTPQPCIPNTTAPWTPGATTVKIAGQAALTDSCQCACMWAGQIAVQFAGQTAIDVE